MDASLVQAATYAGATLVTTAVVGGVVVAVKKRQGSGDEFQRVEPVEPPKEDEEQGPCECDTRDLIKEALGQN